MKVVLYQPQIPQNTGNIVRTCAVTGVGLILVRPLGFSLSSRWLKRAGLDYWEDVDVQVVDALEPLLEKAPCFFFSSKAKKGYHEVSYPSDALLIFGSETTGLPPDLLNVWEERFVTLPMKESARCLNLATTVGIAVYEARRQQGFNLEV